MNIPSFVCVGAQKCGTSSLHDILSNHPDICLPNEKEAHFFYDDKSYEKGLDWYEKFFFHMQSLGRLSVK